MRNFLRRNVLCVRMARPKPSRAEQRARALKQCSRGNHDLRSSFTPGEQFCMACGFVTSCPSCAPTYREDQPMSRAHARLCALHRHGQRGEAPHE